MNSAAEREDRAGTDRSSSGLDSGKQESASDVYRPIAEQGQGTLRRSSLDLALAGLIAGLDIGFGPLAMAVVAGRLHIAFHTPLQQALIIGSFLYPLGFVFVIMGKSELFTENTLAPVAGMLRGDGTLGALVRSWVIIFSANIAGTIVFSLIASHVDVVFTPYKEVYRSMGVALTTQPFLQAILAAIFGGWLVALIGWLIQSTKGSAVHFVVIYVASYLLVALTLYHSIIGSIEVLMGMFAGADITWSTWLGSFLLPALIGNTIGGVVFVAALKGVQATVQERQ